MLFHQLGPTPANMTPWLKPDDDFVLVAGLGQFSLNSLEILPHRGQANKSETNEESFKNCTVRWFCFYLGFSMCIRLLANAEFNMVMVMRHLGSFTDRKMWLKKHCWEFYYIILYHVTDYLNTLYPWSCPSLTTDSVACPCDLSCTYCRSISVRVSQ